MRTPRVLVALSIAGVIALAGCSAGGDADTAEPASGNAVENDAPSDGGNQNEAPGVDEGAGGSADGEAEAPVAEAPSEVENPQEEAPSGIENLEDAGMIFVTTTTVGLQVEDPYQVLGDISAYTAAHGGGRVYRSFTAATEFEGAYGTITVKLPPDELNAAIEQLSTYGEVKSLVENRDDITVRVTNLAARIRIAQMALDRAEQWFAAATTREEEMALEPLLNERIIALDDLQSQQAGDSHDTALSTLTVEVFSPEAAPPPPPPAPEPEKTGFVAGITSGWHSFYEWGSDALRVLGLLLPWLVFLALLVVAAYYIAKPIRKWNDSRPPRPVRPMGPTTAMPMGGQPMVYRTGPGQPGPGRPGPAGQPQAGGQRASLADLLDGPPQRPADAPPHQEPPAPQAPPAPPA